MLRKWFPFAPRNRRSRRRVVAVPKGRRPNAARPALETLEQRELPSCTSSVISRVLTVQCDNTSQNTVTADVQTNDLGTFTTINGQPFNFSTHDSIQIIGGSAGLTTQILANGKPLSLFGHHDRDDVRVGTTNNIGGGLGSLGRIQAPLDLENPPFHNGVIIDDSGDRNASHIGIINVVTIAGFQFEQVTGFGAAAAINAKVADTNALHIYTGPGGAPVNVLATAAFHDTAVDSGRTSLSCRAANTLVSVGHNGSVQGIQGAFEARGYGSIVVDDSADSGNRSVRATFNPLTNVGTAILGLAPAVIAWSLPSGMIRTGTGTVTVAVEVVPRGGITIEGHSANTTVNVGWNNSLILIEGPLTITNPPSFTHVNINDSADTGNHSNVTLTATSLTGLTDPSSGTPPINFGADDLADLTINGGSGTNIYNIVTTQNSGVPFGNLTTLNTGSGADTVNVQGASGAGLRITSQAFMTNVNLGINTLSGIHSPVTIVNGSLFNVTVNDSADNVSHSNIQLANSSLTGLAPAPINFVNNGNRLTINGGGGTNAYTFTASQPSFSVGGTTVNTGAGTDTVYVQSAPGTDPLTVNAGSGSNLVQIGSPANSLDTDQNAMTIHGSGSPLQVVLNDHGNANPATWSIAGGYVGRTGTGGAGAFLSGVTQLTALGGSGGNTFDLSHGVATAMTVVINGGGGSNTLLGSNAANSWQVTGPNMGILSGSSYGSLIGFNQIGSLTAGSGGDTFRFSDQATLSGNLTGSGNTTLDYTLYSTSVIVNLQTGFATGVGGSVTGMLNAIGGIGAPGTPGLYNLLIGNGGNMLWGGIGRRNILVAGGSASTLIGGDSDDLLIGGTTIYDTDPALASWLQIAAYWAGTDDYFTRVGNLTTGSGVPLLDATTVTGNNGGNTFLGNGALALIYSDGIDSISNFDPNSQTVAITP